MGKKILSERIPDFKKDFADHIADGGTIYDAVDSSWKHIGVATDVLNHGLDVIDRQLAVNDLAALEAENKAEHAKNVANQVKEDADKLFEGVNKIAATTESQGNLAEEKARLADNKATLANENAERAEAAATNANNAAAEVRAKFDNAVSAIEGRYDEEVETKITELGNEYKGKQDALREDYMATKENLASDFQQIEQDLKNDFGNAKTQLATEYSSKQQSLEQTITTKQTALENTITNKQTVLENTITSKQTALETSVNKTEMQLVSKVNVAISNADTATGHAITAAQSIDSKINEKTEAFKSQISADYSQKQTALENKVNAEIDKIQPAIDQMQSDFESSEAERTSQFNAKEATRDAANQAALNAAEKLNDLGLKIGNLTTDKLPTFLSSLCNLLAKFVSVEDVEMLLQQLSEFSWGGDTPTPSTVATPIISLNGASATITCATNGAVIYYTTNGSTPNASSTQYTSAVALTNGQTIKAIAIKDGISSNVESKTYSEEPIEEFIEFEDPLVLQGFLDSGIGSGGKISKAQAAAATSLLNSSKQPILSREITKFNEIVYFTGLTNIEASVFQSYSNLTEINELPVSVISIGKWAFYGTNIARMKMPDNGVVISIDSMSDFFLRRASGKNYYIDIYVPDALYDNYLADEKWSVVNTNGNLHKYSEL